MAHVIKKKNTEETRRMPLPTVLDQRGVAIQHVGVACRSFVVFSPTIGEGAHIGAKF